MRLRESVVLEYLSHDKTMCWIAKELKLKRSIVSRIVKRLEKQGRLVIDRESRPYVIKVVDVTPKIGTSIHPMLQHDSRGGVTRPKIWGLRNFAVKFSIQGQQPVGAGWRKFKKGWRGGPAFIKYIRNCRVEAYFGKKSKTLVIYAPRDLEGHEPRTLEHDAIELCKKVAYFLESRLQWSILEQKSLVGGVIPIKRGEYDARLLKGAAKVIRDREGSVEHAHGKIDRSPKPAAFQIYTADWAARVWEAPARMDELASIMHEFSLNIKKHMSILDEMGTTMKDIRDGLKKQKK